MKLNFLSRPISLFLGFISFIHLAGCGGEENIDTGQVIRPVKTATVKGFSQGEHIFPGTVEAGRKLIMSFRVSGRLIELPIKEGENVKKGQLIAKLDPKDYQIALKKVQAQFDKAEADYKRYQSLYERNAVPKADLDLYRSQRDVAKSVLDEAKTNLSYTILRAPFGGRIGNRYVENYMDVQAQQKIADINDNSTMEIKVDFPENLLLSIKSYSEQLKIEHFAEFETEDIKSYPLKLKEVASRADPQTQTFKVTFEMPHPEDITLLPGMTARVRTLVRLKDNAEMDIPITVPAIAVVGDPGSGNFVWYVNKEKLTVHRKTVKVGEMSGSADINILEGLQGGEIIVTAGLSQLEEGMKVRFWDEQDKE